MKKGGDQTSKKSEKKKQAQKLDDKTFGLKNKNKSKAVQGFVKTMVDQVKQAQSGVRVRISCTKSPHHAGA